MPIEGKLVDFLGIQKEQLLTAMTAQGLFPVLNNPATGAMQDSRGVAVSVVGTAGQTIDCSLAAGYTWNVSDDSAKLQAIINAAPVGSEIILPPRFILAAQVTVTRSIRGNGMGSYRSFIPTDAPTICTVNSATFTPFLINTTGISVHDFHVNNIYSGTPTVGSAILWQGVQDGAGSSAVSIYRVSSDGFYDGTISLAGDASSYDIHSCLAIGFVRSGYFFAQTAFSGDNGDGCTFNLVAVAKSGRDPLCGILMVSGGGLKHFGFKLNAEPSANGAKYGMVYAALAGSSTTILTSVGHSIENFSTAAFYITNNPSPTEAMLSGLTFGGAFASVQISGGEMAAYRNGTAALAVLAQGVSNLIVEGNNFLGGMSGVSVVGCNVVTVNSNSHKSASIGTTHLTVDGTSTLVSTDYGVADGPYTPSTNTGASSLGTSDGNIRAKKFFWELNTTSTATMLGLSLGAFSENYVLIRMVGTAGGKGPCYVEEVWSIVQPNTTATATGTLISGIYRNSGSTVTQATCWLATSQSFGVKTASLGVATANGASSLQCRLIMETEGNILQIQRFH